MSHFLTYTLADLRWGRETWRVFLALGAPAFVVAFAFALFHRF